MPTTSRYAGWLPPIENSIPIPISDPGHGGGWFPLKATSVAAVFSVVTAAQSQAESQAQDAQGNVHQNVAHHDALVQAMVFDPALVMMTAASVASDDDFSSRDGSPTGLARWWCLRGRLRWRDTDWLAAPLDNDSATLLRRFAELDDYFRTVPIRRWLRESDPWFQTVGIANPVPEAIQTAWFDHDHTGDRHESINNVHQTIARAIRERDQDAARQASFASAIESTRRGLAHRLAYGLSHEINNPLANISTRAQSLGRVITDVAAKDSLQRIVDQTTRAHAMIADLMFFANPPETKIAAFDWVERVQRVAHTLAPVAMRLGIEIELAGRWDESRLDRNARVLFADAEMIGEAVAVLIRNSIEAIGHDGLIRVEFGFDEQTVHVIVSDSGPGVTREQASMAMDPFYSGREAGRGLGLGLCRADRIAGLHGGTLRLNPALAGCVATLSLPRGAGTIENESSFHHPTPWIGSPRIGVERDRDVA